MSPSREDPPASQTRLQLGASEHPREMCVGPLSRRGCEVAGARSYCRKAHPACLSSSQDECYPPEMGGRLDWRSGNPSHCPPLRPKASSTVPGLSTSCVSCFLAVAALRFLDDLDPTPA
jgi:hypothetical protein